MRMERFPVGAIVVTTVFAIEGLTRRGADVTVAHSDVSYGLASVLAPMMQLGSLDVKPMVLVAAIVTMLFIILAFIETAIFIILRKSTPRVRWAVRVTAAVIAVALLLFTPAVGPIPVLNYGSYTTGPLLSDSEVFRRVYTVGNRA
jgi:hypothetical protein